MALSGWFIHQQKYWGHYYIQGSYQAHLVLPQMKNNVYERRFVQRTMRGSFTGTGWSRKTLFASVLQLYTFSSYKGPLFSSAECE